jgi:hypothetical protein
MASYEDNIRRIEIVANDNLRELLRAPADARDYVIERRANLVRCEDFRRSIAGHIGFDEIASERAREVVGKISAIVAANQDSSHADPNDTGAFS